MRAATYCNPIINRYLADPFILPAGGWFYLYATGRGDDGRFLPLWRSRDLASWEFVRGAVARGAPGAWNRRNFWAPEVLVHQERYWLYYTASPDETPDNTGNRVGLAVSDSPAGPFENLGVLVPHASLDGSPFRDADGSLWLYYTAEWTVYHGWDPDFTARYPRIDPVYWREGRPQTPGPTSSPQPLPGAEKHLN